MLFRSSVLRHDHEAISIRIRPDCVVVGSLQAFVSDVRGSGMQIGEKDDQAGREVLVEEQPHGGGIETSLRSRSAAKARHARMSSVVRSGKSRRISASDMPREVLEHVVDGDAEPPDARLAAPLPRLDGDVGPVVHDERVRPELATVKQRRVLVALYFMWYNFARIHQTLRVTPATEAGRITCGVRRKSPVIQTDPTPILHERNGATSVGMAEVILGSAARDTDPIVA